MSGRIWIAVLVTLAAVFGVRAWNAHLIGQGDAQGAQRVQAAWKQAEAKALAQAASKRAADEAAARTAELAKQKEVERIANEDAQREQAARAALAAATDRNRSLLTTIAQLNANAAAAKLSSSGAQSCTATELDAGTAARNALGECSSRYTTLGGIADRLSNQVMGLQDYIKKTALEGDRAHGD